MLLFAAVIIWGILEIVWRRQWHPTPVLLLRKSHRWRSLVGYSPRGRQESYTTEWLHFHFHALEKEMATHSSVLAWRITGMGAWWAAVYRVTQSQTRLTWLSSSSRNSIVTAFGKNWETLILGKQEVYFTWFYFLTFIVIHHTFPFFLQRKILQ